MCVCFYYEWICVFYGYIVVVNPKPFTSSNCSTFVKTCNCRVHPTSKGQHTQLRTSHPVHSLTLNSNVRGTESTVTGPSHEFFHHFFSRSQAHRLTSSRSKAHKLTLPGSPNSNPAQAGTVAVLLALPLATVGRLHEISKALYT